MAGVTDTVLLEAPDTDPPRQPQWTAYGTRAYRRISLALLLAGFATFSLIYCVQPLLPEFARDFSVAPGIASLALSLTTGLLALAIFVAGAFSQMVPRRGLMFVSMAGAAVLNLAAALTPSFSLLLAARALVGLVLGAGFGIATAAAMAAVPRLGRALSPALVVSQAIPVFALAPILTLWLGFGMAPKVAMVVLIVFVPVAQALYDGLMAPPAAQMDVARTMGAGRWAELRHLRFPSALPRLASGLRLGAIYAPVGAVIGEWVGGARGLGALMIQANGRMKTDLMFAALIVVVALSLTIYTAVDRTLARILHQRGF